MKRKDDAEIGVKPNRNLLRGYTGCIKSDPLLPSIYNSLQFMG